MDLQNQARQRRLYAITIGILTGIALLLRIPGLISALDTATGYFYVGTFLIGTLYALQALITLACCAIPFLFKKHTCAQAAAAPSVLQSAAALVTAAAFSVTAFYLFANSSTIPAPQLSVIAAALFSTLAALFFVTDFLGKPAPLCAYGVILATVLLLSVTYFDRYTPMNAPHKVGLHLCFLSVMLYTLYEIRVLINRARPLMHAATAGIAFSLCAVIGISDLVAFAVGIYNDPLYLMGDLVAVALCIYIAARALPLFLRTPPATDDASPADAEQSCTEEEQ